MMRPLTHTIGIFGTLALVGLLSGCAAEVGGGAVRAPAVGEDGALQLEGEDQQQAEAEVDGTTQTAAAGVLSSLGFISDNFDCPTRNEIAWDFENPAGDGSTAVQAGGFLSITVDETSAHSAFINTNNVPRITQAINDVDFTLMVRFDSTFTAASGVEQTQGILVEESDTRFLRFDFSSFNGQSLLFGAVINVGGAAEGQTSVIGALSLDDPVYLRITRSGADWTLAYSADGAAWTDLTTINSTLMAQRIGFYAGNNAGTAFTANLDFAIDTTLAGSDCNQNEVPDTDELAAGSAVDCDGDGLLDVCVAGLLDCNTNGVDDADDIAGGTSEDCNENSVPDECELSGNDNDADGVLNACDNCPDDANSDQADTDGDGLGDACDDLNDCNLNEIDDADDIAVGTSADCNSNGTPDECEFDDNDCNTNGVPDDCELEGNDDDSDGVLNACDNCPDVANADQLDSDGDGMGNACDDMNDCNLNEIDDADDIAGGTSVDCNTNTVPDECELADNDCNTNGVPDDCDVSGGTSEDCDTNGVPDECELEGNDSDADGVLNACDNCPDDANPDQADSDGDGIGDACDEVGGGDDADGDGVRGDGDECPDSDLGPNIVIGDCSTGVSNELFDTGCTMQDLINDCADSASNHGGFASCTAHLANGWKRDGLITGNQKGQVQRCAAKGFADDDGDDDDDDD